MLSTVSMIEGRAFKKGFTLIEILVVIIIVAVMAGMVSLAVRDDRPDVIKLDALRLTTLLNQAADTAVIEGVELGLKVTEQGAGYEFLTLQTPEQAEEQPVKTEFTREFDNNEDQEPTWLAYDASGFRPRLLSEGIELDVEPIDDSGQGALLDDLSKEVQNELLGELSELPDIMLFSSAEKTAVNILLVDTISDKTPRYRIYTDGFNAFDFEIWQP